MTTRLAAMVKLWVKLTDIKQNDLAEAWGCGSSTVTRFLAGENMPDGPTTARIIAWLFQETAP